MNRFEYMRRLEALLSDISPSEKEEALTYYNDYFNDAGQENEQQVIKELGSPEQVAAGVKEGLGLQSYEREQDSLEGEKSQNQSAPGERDRDAGVQNTRSQNAFSQNNQIPSQPQQKQSKPAWLITLIVIGLILASPLILLWLCGICRDYQCFQSDFRIADWLWSSGSIALCHGICVCSAGICGITGKCSGIRGTAWKRMLMRCCRNPVHDSYCTCGYDSSGSLQGYSVVVA